MSLENVTAFKPMMLPHMCHLFSAGKCDAGSVNAISLLTHASTVSSCNFFCNSVINSRFSVSYIEQHKRFQNVCLCDFVNIFLHEITCRVGWCNSDFFSITSGFFPRVPERFPIPSGPFRRVPEGIPTISRSLPV